MKCRSDKVVDMSAELNKDVKRLLSSTDKLCTLYTRIERRVVENENNISALKEKLAREDSKFKALIQRMVNGVFNEVKSIVTRVAPLP